MGTTTGLDLSTATLSAGSELRSSDPEAIAWIIAGTLTYYYQTMEILQGKNVLNMTLDRLIEALIEILVGDRNTESDSTDH